MSNSLPEAAPAITSQEIFEVFQTVLEKWAFLPSANIGPAVEGPADLPLERKVCFSGAVQGTLVVRSPERFGLYLWENVSGGEKAVYLGALEDAFTEFVNLLCGHLMTRILKVAKGSFEPYLPEISDPTTWPKTEPQVALALLVEDIPVELRVWLEEGGKTDLSNPEALMSESLMNPQELDRKLSQLGARMALCEEDDREGILAIATDLSTWLDFTAGLPSYPTGLLGAQTRQVLQGLKVGRPIEQVCRRLSQTMAEAVHHMERVLSGDIRPTETIRGQAAPVLVAVENFFAINPDDLGGFKDFTAEAPDHLQAIESGLLALVQGEVWDPLKVYRPFHTIKGICGFMGLAGLAKLAHQAEAILERYKNGQGRPTEVEVDLLFAAGDMMKQQTQLIAQGLTVGKFQLVNVEPLLAQIASGTLDGTTTKKAPGAAGEPRESHAHADHFLKIGVEKMDVLLETVGELAICQSQVTEGIALSGVLGHLSTESSRLAKISRQLQEIVLSLRMVPVQPLFQRMSRLGRDLSQKTGKPLRVELDGGETELDKRLTEELVDPLVHLIRNAVDHGIESPENRERAGKPAEAVLSLKASHQGGDFILRVEDDGKGLDYEKLRRKGAALGHVSEDETSPERLTDLIFLPGFSTAEKLTEVSGRGVGLDAVKRKILALKGSIEVQSVEGRGTAFLLRIPLTMALIDGIIVRVGASRYILPSFHVKQFMALRDTENHRVSQGREWLTTHFGHIPMVELAEWFGVKADQKEQSVVVHVQVGEKNACLIVDEVVGKQQVVVKGLGEHLAGLPGVAGGAILGDGQVGFILDLNALVQGGQAKTAPALSN